MKLHLNCLIFEVTHRCNRKCLFCYLPERKSAELSILETKELFRKLFNEVSVGMVALSGGEPLVRKDITSIVSTLNSLGIKNIAIITNGELLTSQMIESLAESGVSYFEVTLLSSDEEVHKRLSGSSGFKRTVDALASLSLFGCQFGISIPLTKLNFPTLKETLELALVFKPSGIIVNRFNLGGRGLSFLPLLMLSREEILESLNLIEKFCEEYRVKIGFPIPLPPCLFSRENFPHITFGFCPLGQSLRESYLTIDPSGNLRPCNHSLIYLGNLLEKSLREILKKERFKKLVSSIPGECLSCGEKVYCQGGCRAASEQYFGDWKMKDPITLLI